MKTFFSFTIAFILAVIIVVMGSKTSPLLGLSAKAATSDEMTYMYRFDKSALANADPKDLINRFLGTSDFSNIHRSDDGTVYFSAPDDLSTTFEHNPATGDIHFHRGMSRYLGDFVPKLPGKDEAIRRTQKFLKANALLPNNVGEIKLAHVGGLRAMNTIDGKQAGPVLDKLVTVSYSRIVDGLPVVGPGSKLVLDLGDQGEVVSLVRHWRELDNSTRKAIPRQELYTSREALALAKRQITAEYGEKVSFKVLSSSRAYFDNNGSILQPVYVFETAISLADRQVKPFNYLCVIQGLKRSPEPLNLTVIDEKAKGLIKTSSIDEKPPISSEKETSD
jgi:hypothetical protein